MASSTSAGRLSARLATLLAGSLFLLCLVMGGPHPVHAAASINTTLYGNSDTLVNTVNSGTQLVMMLETTPSTFDARTFATRAFEIYRTVETAITDLTSMEIVGWCAKKESTLNSSIYCPNGTRFNDDETYKYVFLQMRFPSWSGSTYASPVDVDLSSLGTTLQLVVPTFAGLYDPDSNSTNSLTDYVTNVSYNSAAVYAVFSVLLVGVVIALIVMCVCICKRDNAIASTNHGIIDKAINKLRFDRSHSKSRAVVYAAGPDDQNNNLASNYNVRNAGASVTLVPPPAESSPRDTLNEAPPPAAATGGAQTADEREMRDMRGRQVSS